MQQHPGANELYWTPLGIRQGDIFQVEEVQTLSWVKQATLQCAAIREYLIR
jgi:hypothetical protein